MARFSKIDPNISREKLIRLVKEGVVYIKVEGTNLPTTGVSGTCKSCKRRYDDAHFSFPDCWDNHEEENKRRGVGCLYYEFDEEVL